MSDETIAIQFAKLFATNGYFVFPLYSSRKGPQKPFGWARNVVDAKVDKSKVFPATTDPSIIDAWPAEIAKSYDGATVVGYGVLGINKVIFDLDNKDGKDGSEQFRLLMDTHRIPKPEFVVKSKSGGFHLYYTKSEKFQEVRVKSVAGTIISSIKYEGVDVRGDGGMVVGPMSQCAEADWRPGNYSIIKGSPASKLSVMTDTVVAALSSTSFSDPLDNLMGSASESDDSDVIEVLKRGELPKFLPRGARNHGFYVFINGLRNKGISATTAKSYVAKLVEVTEDREDLANSVNIEEMIARIYEVDVNNPYDVAKDLINRGLHRVTGHGNKIKYVIFNENPYYSSIGYHDLASMKQLMDRFSRLVPVANGKERLLNPAELLDKLMDTSKEVDIASFKPGAPDIFYSSELGGKRFLNVWRDVRKLVVKENVDDEAWDQFRLVVSRIFGPEGSPEYQFGLDLPAWLIQNPGIKPVVVPFIQSAHRGVGKSCYMNALRHVMSITKDGVNQARSVKLEEIGARFFNPNGASLLMLDEVQFATHRNTRQEATGFWKHLKTLITAPVISVEIKGGGTFEMPCVSGMIMAGNSGNHFPIEEADRRIWIIDNNAPILSRGLADKLFDLESAKVGQQTKIRTANSIRYHLTHHKIKHDLSDMRAPMNDVKREMFLSGLTDLEEWFITHFENPENLGAASPIVTKEMVLYVLETSEKMMNSRWRENPEETFRELKKRGMLHSIRTKGMPTLTRQLTNFPNINNNGSHHIDKTKNSLMTCRDHGQFNEEDNTMLKQCLATNVQSIMVWRSAAVQNRGATIINS